MNQEFPTPEQPVLSAQELQDLLREGDPPLTRRELRLRDRAEEAGLLTRDGGRLVIADPAPSPAPASARAGSEEPPLVTSADVLAGNVPAASGLTRRQLRELAAQGAAQDEPGAPDAVDTGELEETVESAPLPDIPVKQEPPAPVTPQRISTRVVASELDEQHIPQPPRGPEEQTARRPVVHPEGARTGEYTGEFDQIRQAMADINAAPDSVTQKTTPPNGPVFEASIPEGLTSSHSDGDSPVHDTNAADWTAVIESPVVTDDLLPDLQPVQPAVPETFEPDTSAPENAAVEAQSEVPLPGDGNQAFPDWHALTSIPAVAQTPQSEPQSIAHAATEPQRQGGPLWLTVLQWLVIAAVAVVLGLLVWYAINRGFGNGTEDAAGIVSPFYHLRI